MTIPSSRDRTPVTILTGFLGSGKTTLLRRLLTADRMDRTAIVINEFGEIGLDHLLVRSLNGNAVVLQNGCVCCTIRADVQSSFRELIDGRSAGTVPDFDRIVLETTGLADPVPIVQTLVGDPMLRSQARLSNIVTTVDALHGLDQMRDHPESLRQAAVADRLVITKSDLADSDHQQRLRGSLQAVNPMADLFDAHRDEIPAASLILQDAFHPDLRDREIGRWLAALPAADRHEDVPHARSRHDHDIRAVVFRTQEPVDWAAFGVWLSALVHRHGKRILRIKGLLNLGRDVGPLVLNGVQTVVHPPLHLDAWPDGDDSTRIIFIVQGLDGSRLLRSLGIFLTSAASPASDRRASSH